MSDAYVKGLEDVTGELKPCPFCGGKPYLANVEMVGCAYVVCTDCRTQSDEMSKERAIAAWNTRVDNAAADRIEELEAQLAASEAARVAAEAWVGAETDKCLEIIRKYEMNWDDACDEIIRQHRLKGDKP